MRRVVEERAAEGIKTRVPGDATGLMAKIIRRSDGSRAKDVDRTHIFSVDAGTGHGSGVMDEPVLDSGRGVSDSSTASRANLLALIAALLAQKAHPREGYREA